MPGWLSLTPTVLNIICNKMSHSAIVHGDDAQTDEEWAATLPEL
jgi:hypothetical protein